MDNGRTDNKVLVAEACTSPLVRGDLAEPLCVRCSKNDPAHLQTDPNDRGKRFALDEAKEHNMDFFP